MGRDFKRADTKIDSFGSNHIAMAQHKTIGEKPDSKARCLSCEVTSGRLSSTGGVILETELFHAHQDLAYPIPGLVILAAKRHFYAMDEMTEEERLEFMGLIHRIRAAQRNCLQIDTVYYFYNEDTTHHFHLWMVPRYPWMHQFGRSVESLRPALLHARNHLNTPENIAMVLEAALLLKAELSR